MRYMLSNLVLESESPKWPIPESLQTDSGKKEPTPELHASKKPKEPAPGESDSWNRLTSTTYGINDVLL